MTAHEEATAAREFRGSVFYKSVFVPYLESRKGYLRDKVDEFLLKDKSSSPQGAVLSGRRREITEMETWLDTLFKRSLETKGS